MSYPFFLGRGRHPAAYRLVVDDHVDYTDDLRRHQAIRISQSVYIVIRLVSDVDRTLRSRSFDRVQIHTRLNRRCAIRNQQNSHVPDDHTRVLAHAALCCVQHARQRKREKGKITSTRIHMHRYTRSTYGRSSCLSVHSSDSFYDHSRCCPIIFYSIIGDRAGDVSSSHPRELAIRTIARFAFPCAAVGTVPSCSAPGVATTTTVKVRSTRTRRTALRATTGPRHTRTAQHSRNYRDNFPIYIDADGFGTFFHRNLDPYACTVTPAARSFPFNGDERTAW